MPTLKEWLASLRSAKKPQGPVVLLDRTAKVQRLYTKRALLYHLFWVKLLGWEKALGKFFQEHDYDCPRPGLKILDAGCGTGAATRALYKIACGRNFSDTITFHAFDLTPAMLGLFKKWSMDNGIEGNISLRRANVLNLDRLPPDWNEYDLIVVSGMLEHLPENEMITALNNLKRLLKNDGVLLAFITAAGLFTDCFSWHLKRRWWTNIYSADQLHRIFFDAGFNDYKFAKVQGAWGLMTAVKAKNSSA